MMWFLPGVCALAWMFWRWSRRAPVPSWLGWMIERENPFCPPNRSDRILQLLDLEPRMRVLDVGCGPGRLTLPLAQEGHRVIALDLQPEMLQKIQAKADTLSNICFVEGELQENQFQDLDRALLATVLGEVPNPSQLLSRLLKSLKPGGILLITESRFDPHFLKRTQVEQLALSSGFALLALEHHRMGYALKLQRPLT